MKELIGKASDAQIAIYKEKYGEVFEVVIEDSVCYLKKPDRKTLSFATSFGDKDPMKFNEVMLENCWIAGDERIKTDDEYFFACIGEMEALIQVKEAQLKKL
jgi:hypothetical protein